MGALQWVVGSYNFVFAGPGGGPHRVRLSTLLGGRVQLAAAAMA